MHCSDMFIRICMVYSEMFIQTLCMTLHWYERYGTVPKTREIWLGGWIQVCSSCIQTEVTFLWKCLIDCIYRIENDTEGFTRYPLILQETFLCQLELLHCASWGKETWFRIQQKIRQLHHVPGSGRREGIHLCNKNTTH